MKHLQARTWTRAEVDAHQQVREWARVLRDPEADCARLRALAEADPGNPAPWARYCVAVQVASHSQRRPRRPSRRAAGPKPPVGDVLALTGSQLAPDVLWRGPAPEYPPDRED